MDWTFSRFLYTQQCDQLLFCIISTPPNVAQHSSTLAQVITCNPFYPSSPHQISCDKWNKEQQSSSQVSAQPGGPPFITRGGKNGGVEGVGKKPFKGPGTQLTRSQDAVHNRFHTTDCNTHTCPHTRKWTHREWAEERPKLADGVGKPQEAHMQTAAAFVSRLLSVLFAPKALLSLFASWFFYLQNNHQTPRANQSSLVAEEGERAYMASFPVHNKH